MFIPMFWLGVLATIVGEFLLVFIFSLVEIWRERKCVSAGGNEDEAAEEIN
jgi:hypothetical protein